MKRIYGQISGLKGSQIRRLENLYRRRMAPELLVSPEVARDTCRLSAQIRRQIALLINRRGRIQFVIVGDRQGIVIPDISEYRSAPGRLKGLRCIHTHLTEKALDHDDLTDLALLRLDLMAAITVKKEGLPHRIHYSHILPSGPETSPYQVLDPIYPHELDIGCLDLITAIENELSHTHSTIAVTGGGENALLVSLNTKARSSGKASLAELEDLARSAGLAVAGAILQQRSKPDPRFFIGKGKLKELSILALHRGAGLIVFDQELNPSQIRSITDLVELKVIDRTQLILDIFAQRARTKEGKLQVELAQLKYLLPRLVTKNTAMSRLTGGIGGRGPGETKLEVNRRRARQRITQLENDLLMVRKRRKQQRHKRSRGRLPIISIVGYTNAGKSTLLNTLTHSRVLAEKRLFATLDPSSRRLRFPRDTHVIITDTVGFIRNLPKDLMVAFRATLEELDNADLLLHVIDISNPRFEDQIRAVERIINDLKLQQTPILKVLNKMDRVPAWRSEQLCDAWGGIAVSALDRTSLRPLITQMEACIGITTTSAGETHIIGT
jgi:GTP-binding protein HflX